MLDGVFKVFKNEFIDITCGRTGNILFGRSREQRHIAEHTGQIKVKDTAKGTRLAHYTSLTFGITAPIDIFFLGDKLVATEHGFIIVYPIHIKEIIVRRSDTSIELVNHVVVFVIRETKTAQSLLGCKFRQQVHAHACIGNGTLPSIVAAHQSHFGRFQIAVGRFSVQVLLG